MATCEYRLPQIKCSPCNAMEVGLGEVEYEVEGFGKVLIFVTTCGSCGFRDTDVFSLTTHEPTMTSLRITFPAGLKMRFVRSGTSTMKVPELGVSIESSINNEEFVSNVEGALARIESELQFISRSLKRRKKQKASPLLRKVQRAMEGRLPFTIVLKDTFDSSVIASSKAKRWRLSSAELKKLNLGEHIVTSKSGL